MNNFVLAVCPSSVTWTASQRRIGCPSGPRLPLSGNVVMSAWDFNNGCTLIRTLQVILPTMNKLHQNLVSPIGIVALLFRFGRLQFPLFGWRQRHSDEGQHGSIDVAVVLRNRA